jgi:prolipoprotein diacylglyceryltransferase
MNPDVWNALVFALLCYGILLVMSLFVAALIMLARWATAPRAKLAKASQSDATSTSKLA